MRYFRMYVVIGMLMAGVIHTAEAPDGVSAGVDEDPPQILSAGSISDSAHASSDKFSENAIPGTEDKDREKVEGAEAPVAEVAPTAIEAAATAASVIGVAEQTATETKASGESNAVAPSPDEPKAEEPTIEDAEKLDEESAKSIAESLGALPPQPGSIPGELPAEPKAQEVTPATEQLIEKSQGISTIDLEQPQGNWVFKRYWWERAEELYKKMRNNVEKINDLRVKFFARRTELDKTILDPFYADIGLAQSELQASMQMLMAQLEQEREKDGMLSDEEREMRDTMQKDRERLEQLQRDVNEVGTLRDAADKVVDRVMDQKNRAAKYESDGWDDMREIGRIVSDTQASELYYRMDAGWKTMKTIYNYIDQDLTSYFDQLLINAREQTERIKTALQALKEQGVDLKQQMDQIKEHEVAQEVAHAEEEEKKVAVPVKTGWFGATSRLFQAVIDVALWQFLQSIWDVIMWLPRRIYSTISSLFR